MRETADVVVIGAGTAGAGMVARLSQDASRQVLALEAGAVPRSLAEFDASLVDAARVAGADPSLPAVRRHPSRASSQVSSRGAGSRDLGLVSGLVAGGSSTINGGSFVWPTRADAERWQALGAGAWSPEAVSSGLRALETDLDFGDSEWHGGTGPVPVQRTSVDHPVAERLFGAAARLGFASEPDKNGWGAEGYGPVPCNVRDGVRWNTALSMLAPALGRPNVAVRAGARARRLIIADGNIRGVEYSASDGIHVVMADRVVLCAGAIASAHLLLVSGIGPADDLRAAGVPVIVDAPGVGAAVSNNPQLVVEWMPRGGAPIRSAPASGVASSSDSPLGNHRPGAAPRRSAPLGVDSSEPRIGGGAERHRSPGAASWLAGVLHSEGVEVLATAHPLAQLAPRTGDPGGTIGGFRGGDGDRSSAGGGGDGLRGGAGYDDGQPGDLHDTTGEAWPPDDPLALMCQVVTPRRQGRLRLVNDDPEAPPDLDLGYLVSAEERADLRRAARLCLDLLGSREWRGQAVNLDAATAADDAALDAWIAANLGTAMHPCGTVPFGFDDAPVDSSGHVHGVTGLQVVDASILPTAPSRGPAPTVTLLPWLVG